MFNFWYQRNLISDLLLPITCIYKQLAKYKKKKDLAKQYRPSVPVVIIGNITVGGSGKSPFVRFLCAYLSKQGYRVGVLSRGYKSQFEQQATIVQSSHTAAQVGDEVAALQRYVTLHKLNVIIAVGANRSTTAQLIEQQVDVIIADDGLQHYRLARDFEVIMINGQYRFYNQRLFPAGPLREEISRIKQSHLLINNIGPAHQGELLMSLIGSGITQLGQFWQGQIQSIEKFLDQVMPDKQVCLLSGLADNSKFISSVKQVGLQVIEAIGVADHQQLSINQLQDLARFKLPILITEKDAIKLDPSTLGELTTQIYVFEIEPHFTQPQLLQDFYQHLIQAINHRKK